MASILVVDDDRSVLDAMARVLRRAGHTLHTAATGAEALAVGPDAGVEVALLDMSLPDMTGMDLLATLLGRDPSVPCVFVTAFGSIPSAVAAMRAGAFDYLTKPFDNDLLLFTVERAVKFRHLNQRVSTLEGDAAGRELFPEIVGSSAAMQKVRTLLAKAAASDVTVVLTGESGTGKELAARGLHRHSRRAGGPFIAVNCAAIPGGLAEAELFGVERGAYTDAREARPGVFERADGGTLFLDEIGDMSPDVQAKLLRVLQDREVTRLGGQRARRVDVRIVAATNRDLRQTERFRSDVLFRLQGFPIRLPSLRERPEDLPILIAHVIDRTNAELHTQVAAVSPRLQAWLADQPFPGNVRELQNLLRYGILLCEGPVLDVADYPNLEDWRAPGPPHESGGEAPDRLSTLVARATAEVERTAIETALRQHHGKRHQAAQALGIGRRTLFKKMQLYGLAASDDSGPDDES